MRQRILRLVCWAIIIGLPTATTLRQAAEYDAPARPYGDAVDPSDGDRGLWAAEYLAQRDPRVDLLLPGAGGGRYFVEGMDVAGRALLHLNAILLAPIMAMPSASTEVHELAHLAHYNLPRESQAVLALLPPPLPGTYAATNDLEHFAELAAGAWEVFETLEGVCMMGDESVLLEHAEAQVPGTAGFVAYFLTIPGFATDSQIALLEPLLARMISAEQRVAWQGLWDALDARRGADGRPQPWTRRTALDLHQAQVAMTESPVMRALLRALYFPSELLVRVVAR